MSDHEWQRAGIVVDLGPGRQPSGLRDRVVQEQIVGGPLTGRDTRMYLDQGTLEHLLDVCRASLTGRVVVHGAGFRVKTWEGGDGKRYDTLTIIGREPEPENSPLLAGLRGRKG